jgi:Fic family protein
MAGGERDTKASRPALITDPQEKAQREAENAIRQFDRVLDMIDLVAREGRPFRLRPSMILDLHAVAMDGLSDYAGNWRPDKVEIGESKHQPPERFRVPSLIEEMCDWVNENWQEKNALQLCSYVMWRLNWIHPFDDGNGRTSRALSYLVLCAKLGDRLPGRKTLPEQIAENKTPYYDALEKADQAWQSEQIDTSAMETLLESYLAVQLNDAFSAAKADTSAATAPRKLH